MENFSLIMKFPGIKVACNLLAYKKVWDCFYILPQTELELEMIKISNSVWYFRLLFLSDICNSVKEMYFWISLPHR